MHIYSRIRRLLPLLLCLAVLCLSVSSEARKKEPKKEPARIRISVSLSDMADSVAAYGAECEKELYEGLELEILELSSALVAKIDSISAFARLRPRTYLGELAVSLAREHLGKPYRWAADGPDQFDCSGFTRYIYRQIGIDIPRHSGEQYRQGPHIEVPTDLREGDLVFFGTRRSWRSVGHVGIVVAVDRERGIFSFIHASSSGGVRISLSNEDYFVTRFIGGCRYIRD